MLDNIRPTLTSVDDLNLERVAVIADKILESAQSAVLSAATTESASTNDAISALTRQIEHLNRRLDRLERQGRGRGKSSQRSQSSHRYLCWYHRKFGEKANKCNEPCNFTEKRFRTAEVQATGGFCEYAHLQTLLRDGRASKIHFLIDTGSDVSVLPLKYKNGGFGK